MANFDAVKYLISLGSNLGNRLDNLERAKDMLSARLGNLTEESAVYETAPWGFVARNWFLNQVVLLESAFEPEQLLEAMLNIEAEMGRERSETGKYQSRIIDMDILLADGLIVETSDLKLPHPKMHERNFVLVPAVEIAADWVHPLLDKTLEVILTECRDKEEVRKR